VTTENRLHSDRLNQNVSHSETEETSGVSGRSLEFVENVDPAIAAETLEVLAEAPGTPVEQFFHEHQQEPSFPNLANRLTCDDIVGLKRRK
jgi:hypothetical protein